jgi:hypothetical protein
MVDESQTSSSLEAALGVEFGVDPSPAAAAAIDRRMATALGARPRSAGAAGGSSRLRTITLAPLTAVIAALVLGILVVAAALILTAEDQRVYDLTACMRDRGWEVADPDVEGGSGHVVPGFPTIVEESRQAAFNADLEQCATNAGIPLEP